MVPFDIKGPVAVAVSGGPDSMALLALAQQWAHNENVPLTALTVDHQLRAEAKAEAAMVAAWCAAHDISHHTLVWERDAAPCGNLQAAARNARYALMGAWCVANKVEALAVAHHADDQAETLLMRLARGSGVDGLAAMAAEATWPVAQEGAPRLLRPLLGVRRAALEAFCQAHDLPVVRDPSNEDASYDRVATRQTIAALDLDVERLTRTARLMAEEKAALDWATEQALGAVAEISPHGFICFNRTAFGSLPAALAGRVLRRALSLLVAGDYPPRKDALLRLQQAVCAGQGHTLAGVGLSPDGKLSPEHPAKPLDLPVGQACPWDARFTFAAAESGWRVLARADLVASRFSSAQIDQISTLPAAVRGALPVLIGPDGQPHLPTFGEKHEKVSILAVLGRL